MPTTTYPYYNFQPSSRVISRPIPLKTNVYLKPPNKHPLKVPQEERPGSNGNNIQNNKLRSTGNVTAFTPPPLSQPGKEPQTDRQTNRQTD